MLTRDLTRCLTNKCKFELSGGSKHDKYSLTINDRVVAITVVSRSYSDIGDDILKKISGQIGGLTLGQLKRLVECTLSREEYIQLLQRNGRLDR